MKLKTKITSRSEALQAIDMIGAKRRRAGHLSADGQSLPPGGRVDATWRRGGRAGPNDQTGRPDRPIGQARRTPRAGPTDISGRPGRHFGQARINGRAGGLLDGQLRGGVTGNREGRRDHLDFRGHRDDTEAFPEKSRDLMGTQTTVVARGISTEIAPCARWWPLG